MPDIPDFTDATWHRGKVDPQLMISILEGKGRFMPTWWGRVNDQMAADLVRHIRTFGPAPEPSSTTASVDFGGDFNKLRQQWLELDKQLHAIPAPPAAAKGTPPPAVVAAVPTAGPNSGAGRFFGQSCAGCHTIGGGALTGPDLKDVTKRRDRDWLASLLLDPKGVVHSGDPYALQLLSKARGVTMPNIFGMTRERAETMLDFIESQSQLEKSWFSELPISGRPLTVSDADRGRELFVGTKPLANGGAACILCHSAGTNGGQEGGRLGPDLTKIYERVGGRTALSARLWTPVTPMMLPLYQQHSMQEDEVLSLVAYLEQTARQGVEQDPAPPLNFLLMGLGGTVVGLGAVSTVWGFSRRSRS
jgi:mono/diheme cytochrome c family protein